MSDFNYALDILKDDLNELQQMQAVPKYAMEGKVYIERTNSLHAAIKALEQANGATTGEKQCNLPVVSPRLFYVVAPCQYEEGNLEQITNGLTYERAVAYRDGDFCKDRWPNAYILASLNEG